MFYLIYSEDVDNSLEKRLAVREQHLARLTNLQDQGRLLIAGPCPAIDSNDPGAAGFTGSLIVAEFDSLTQAQAWADVDPYVAAGVYKKVTVKPYKKVLPA
ncbi:YciI family protein [Candidatus Colwellia aromaticivorans]|uniref:YciI family protein n=1 Tax=Candidatus Colwellia aromaticivorans TaxID=2267621 RepID=UPI000DF33855|nr:YciI family protein [Candidatus Colwellia aromaticivorans]